MSRELKSGGCRRECAWGEVDDTLDGRALFACACCGSEWVFTEAWTPRNADGELAPGVAAERAAHPVESSSPW